MEGLQSLIRAKIMLEKQHAHALKTGRARPRRAFERARLLPVQVNEEAEQVIAQLNHGLLHVGLELTPVVDLRGVKHAHVPHRDLYAPEGRGRLSLHEFGCLSAHEQLTSDGSLVGKDATSSPARLSQAKLTQWLASDSSAAPGGCCHGYSSGGGALSKLWVLALFSSGINIGISSNMACLMKKKNPLKVLFSRV